LIMKTRRISNDAAKAIAQRITTTRTAPLMSDAIRLQAEAIEQIKALIVNNADIEAAGQAMTRANPFLIRKIEGCDYSGYEFQNELRISARAAGSDDFISHSKACRVLSNCIEIEITAQDEGREYIAGDFQVILEPGESAWISCASNRYIELKFPVTHPIVQSSIQFTKAVRQSQDAASELYRELRSNIERAGTTSRLIDLWPEVKQIVLDHYNEVEHVEVPLDSIIKRHVVTALAAPAA
jgi:hypothetical protein